MSNKVLFGEPVPEEQTVNGSRHGEATDDKSSVVTIGDDSPIIVKKQRKKKS